MLNLILCSEWVCAVSGLGLARPGHCPVSGKLLLWAEERRGVTWGKQLGFMKSTQLIVMSWVIDGWFFDSLTVSRVYADARGNSNWLFSLADQVLGGRRNNSIQTGQCQYNSDLRHDQGEFWLLTLHPSLFFSLSNSAICSKWILVLFLQYWFFSGQSRWTQQELREPGFGQTFPGFYKESR